jgi:hypothetical protein
MAHVASAQPLVVDLLDEIKAVVRLHAYDTVSPPFRPAELALMAWVCCRNYDGIVTQEQIFKWAVKSFKYYSHLAVNDAYNINRYKKRQKRVPHLQNLFNGIATEITLHDVPIYPVSMDVDSDDSDHPPAGSAMYVSSLVKARTFLRRTLGNETRDFKRFLDLPAEIRLMIYAEVFSYEGNIEFTNPMLHLPAPRRAIRNTAYDQDHLYDQAFDDGECLWSLPEERETVTGLSGEIMSLLLVNRQIFQEAMPIFYKINTFQVAGIQELSRMLRLCGARRRVYFSRIEFEHCYLGSKELTKKVFKMLGQMKQLQHFAVRAQDTRLPLGLYDMYPGSVRWINLLCSLKCTSVDVLGDCPKIHAYMQEYRAKKALEGQQAETDTAKPAKPSKRCKKVFKSEAVIRDA